MDRSIELQHHIKQQAESIRDYSDDLARWEEQIAVKDGSIAKGARAPDLPPVRGRAEPSQTNREDSRVREAGKETVLKRDTTNMQTYYKAWDRFDPDGYLEELDKQQSPQTVKPQLQAPAQAAPARSKLVVKGGRSIGSSELDRLKDQGTLLFTAHDYPKALDCYQQCLALNPDHSGKVVLHSNSAQCLIYMREYARAEEEATRALELESRHVKSLVRRAVAGRSLDRFRRALEGIFPVDLELARTADPGNAQLGVEIAKTHKMRERKVAELKEAMVLST